MGVFGAVFGCRGDAGFRGPLLGASSGVVGFNVAALSCLVREKVRPAWPDVCVSAKKFALRTQNTPKSAFCGVLGELFRGSAAEQPLQALTVSVRMRVGSPCGRLSSAGEKFRMQFPSRHFK